MVTRIGKICDIKWPHYNAGVMQVSGSTTAIGVLHIITLVPFSRKFLVQGALRNNRVGVAVLLDVVKGLDCVDHEAICPALNVLVNLVCPPPSISNKPSSAATQQPAQAPIGSSSEIRDRNVEKSASDKNLTVSQGESQERFGDGNTSQSHQGNTTQISTPVVSSGVVGDQRITLEVGAGGPGLAAQLEQGYHQAREVVRANNGIKILLQLLSSRVVTHPVAIDSIRALAFHVLLGLARDDMIAHILTKLQVGKKLSELIRDTSAQASGGDSARWQAELTQVAIELIGVLTNSGKETTLAATDAAAPALRRIERAGIAAATPISYHSRELMQLIHEHMLQSGFTATAAMLQKEAGLTPFPMTAAVLPVHQVCALEALSVQQAWPYGRVQGFLLEKANVTMDQSGNVSDSVLASSKKKALTFSSSFSQRTQSPNLFSGNRTSSTPKSPLPSATDTGDAEMSHKTPLSMPLKRKLVDMKDANFASLAKRPCNS